ncbi:MAG TPA: lysophospholipid acyltransferase family protein [Gemmatimonadales bacterium]|nr:lysophospholipid acyltransferase family protein [Gemmatimonadales bacterium]
MIRAVRYVVALVGFSLWHASKTVLAGLLGVPHRPEDIYDRSGRAWARGILRWCRIAVTVEGRERLVPRAPCVYIANHASFVDILAILQEIPGTLRFVYKRGMSWIPILGWGMRFCRHIPIDRKRVSAAFAAYDEAAEYIRQGTCAVVFAEGTRSRDGRLMPFKKGPFVLAIAAQAPVVPVACLGTFELLPKGSCSAKPGTVTLRIGEPIATAGMTYQEREGLAARTREAIVELGVKQ